MSLKSEVFLGSFQLFIWLKQQRDGAFNGMTIMAHYLLQQHPTLFIDFYFFFLFFFLFFFFYLLTFNWILYDVYTHPKHYAPEPHL